MNAAAMPCQRRSTVTQGFTLVEMMVAVAIISILAAVAVPQYNSYVMRSRIPDATSALAARAVQSEQFFQDNRTFANTAAANNPGCVADTTSSKYFNFSCASADATSFIIQAVGKSKMAGFTYTVNQAGAKATTAVPAGWTSSATCWVARKDGSC